VIEHIDDVNKVMDETYRVLGKTGFVIIVTPNRRRLTSIVSIFLRLFKNVKYPLNPNHIFEFAEEDLRSIFGKTQFKNYCIKPIGFGIMLENHVLGLKHPKGLIYRFCNQWLICANK